MSRIEIHGQTLTVLEENWEYAGFRYRIIKDGMLTNASPHFGQHRAAGREKHLRAAIETYLEAHPR